MVIGVLRLGRTARSRWEPVSLGVGILLTVTGFVLPAVAEAYLLGLLVLCVALLKGISQQGRGPASLRTFASLGGPPGRPGTSRPWPRRNDVALNRLQPVRCHNVLAGGVTE